MISDKDYFLLSPERDSAGKLLPLEPDKLFPTIQPLYIEIGCGKGEFISSYSVAHPEINILGFEAADKRIVNTLKKLSPEKNPNVRLMRLFVDATLCDLLPHKSVSGIFIQHPDPWPKRKHHRRRLIQREFLDALVSIMKPDAEVQISTDHQEYAAWILEEFIAHPGFISVFDDLLRHNSPFEQHITTWYETEQRRQGFNPQFMLFKRI